MILILQFDCFPRLNDPVPPYPFSQSIEYWSYFDKKTPLISDPLLLKRNKHTVICNSMVRCTESGDVLM